MSNTRRKSPVRKVGLVILSVALAALASLGVNQLLVRHMTASAESAPPSTTAPVEPSLGEIPRIAHSDQVPMPLDPYMTSMDDIRLIDQARDVGAAVCMRSLGYTEWTESTIRTWRPGEYREVDMFDYLDPKSAAEVGYPQQAEEIQAATTGPVHEPTPMERRAYDGATATNEHGKAVPAGGCAAEADRRIYGKEVKLPADPRSLAVASRSRAIGDSRVQAALGAWRTCMADHKLPYQHPITAENDPRWESRQPHEPATAEERRVAGLDAACRSDANLVGIYKAVRAAYEGLLVTEYQGRLSATGPVFAAWVANAKTIIEANK